MTNSYVSYNAMDAVGPSDPDAMSDENPHGDSEALLKAANKKRAQADKEPLTRKKKRKSKAKKAEPASTDELPTSETRPKRKPVGKSAAKSATKGKRKAKKKTPAEAIYKSSADQGLLTKGVHAGLRGFDSVNHAARTLSLSAWIGSAASVVFMALSAYAWHQSPAAPTMDYHLKSFHVVNTEQILPKKIWATYISQYPRLAAWCVKTPGKDSILKEPNTEELTHFIQYLEDQRCIAAVKSIHMGYVEGDIQQRVLLCDLQLRVPEMKIIMANGQANWVDSEGVHLPGILPVPEYYESRPRIHNIDNHDDALMEVLSFWPLLEDAIEEGLIVSINLDDVLQRSLNEKILQRGIVLTTKSGTRILWGRVGDSRYGMTAQGKVQKLLHTLRSQGDPKMTKIIDLRHKNPKYILAQGPS